MYEEPIKLIESQMRTEIENEIFRAIKEVGVDVNKEELIKALQYDRHQYSKGYKDGYEDGMTKFAERLKEKADRGFWQEYSYISIEDIDNLLKEIANDSDECDVLSSPSTFEYKGYILQQSSYNNHYMILKDDKMIMHCQCKEKLDQKGAEEAIDFYLDLISEKYVKNEE